MERRKSAGVCLRVAASYALPIKYMKRKYKEKKLHGMGGVCRVQRIMGGGFDRVHTGPEAAGYGADGPAACRCRCGGPGVSARGFALLSHSQSLWGLWYLLVASAVELSGCDPVARSVPPRGVHCCCRRLWTRSLEVILLDLGPWVV